MTKLKNTDEKCECHCHMEAHDCYDYSFHQVYCDNCNPEKQGDDWEREFDEKYQSFELCDTVSKGDFDRLKQFIRQLEKQTRESVIESEKDYWFNKGCAFAFHCCDCGYCQEKEQEYRLKMDKLKQKTKE